MIKIIDNVIPLERLKEVERSLTYNHPWYFSSDENLGTKKQKLTLGTIRQQEEFSAGDLFLLDILNKRFNTQNIVRSLRNCFRKSDKAQYHQDPGKYTYMFYVNSVWKRHWGAPTKFKEKRCHLPRSVYPKPGRLVVFSSKLWHKGESPTMFMPDYLPGRLSIAFHEI